MSRVKQGFRVELDPSPEQVAAMGRHAGLSRFVENFCLDKIRAAFAQRAAEQTYGIPADQLTRAPWTGIDLEKLWRAEHREVAPWFAGSGLSSRIPKQACRLRAAGLKNWWESKTGTRKGPKLRFPKIRKRKNGSRFRYDADRAKPSGDQAITLPGVPGKVARTRLGSKNRAKARQKVAALHLKVAHRRSDFLHQLTTRLARTKRAVAVESLNVAGMVRNRRLARAVSDAGFGEFIRQLTYKADWYGSKVWAADRWFPSSKTCADCGAINAGLTLAQRSWVCQCGATHDRDHNAARNLLAAMHAA